MRYFKIVFNKELKDLFRNGTSLFLSIILPALLFPILIIMLLNSQETTESRLTQTKVILLDNTGTPLSLDDELYQFVVQDLFDNNENIIIVHSNDLYNDLMNEELDLIIEVIKIENADYSNYVLNLIYNQANQNFAGYVQVISNVLGTYTSKEILSRLSVYGFDYSLISPATPILVGSNDYFTDIKKEGIFNRLLIVLIPMAILSFITLGSASYSGELFTMEKERKTLESLLATRAPRMSIFFGKYAVVVLISIVSAVVQLISLALTVVLKKDNLGEFSMYFEPSTIILMSLSLLVLCLLSSTISVFIYVVGKNNKSVGAISSIYALLPILLSYSTGFLSPSSINTWYAFIPFYNTLVATKLSFVGATNQMLYYYSIGINLLITSLVLFFNVRIFKSEKVLGSKE